VRAARRWTGRRLPSRLSSLRATRCRPDAPCHVVSAVTDLLGLQAPRDVCLAAADDATRQRCVRVIQAASAGGASSSLLHIASAAALTGELLKMKSLPAVNAVLAALGKAKVKGLDVPSLKAAGFDVAACRAAGYNLPSLKAAGFDAAAFRAAGCSWSDLKAAGFTSSECKATGCDLPSLKAAGFDAAACRAAGYDLPLLKAAGFDATAFRAAGLSWSDLKAAGFTSSEVKAAGCNLASAQVAGFDVPSLVVVYGYDAVKAAGVNLNSYVLHDGPNLYMTLHCHKVDDRNGGHDCKDGDVPVHVPAGWHIAPGDANDIRVCHAHYWQGWYLVFANGYAFYTKISYHQGTHEIVGRDNLIQDAQGVRARYSTTEVLLRRRA
jgi:hypothetical protein